MKLEIIKVISNNNQKVAYTTNVESVRDAKIIVRLFNQHDAGAPHYYEGYCSHKDVYEKLFVGYDGVKYCESLYNKFCSLYKLV